MSSAENISASSGRAPETIPISALNHFLYCSRRAFLIHGEGVFVDNEHTLLGDLAHEHVDFPGFEQRDGSKLLRALPLFSDRLGLSGKADLVEVEEDAAGRVVSARPVEYKKGSKRRFDNDEVQLCAQAFCLEEMFALPVPAGAIFYAQSQRRLEIVFDAELRRLTGDTITATRALLAADRIPAAELKPQCEGCSLHEVCLPELARSKGAWTSAELKLYTPVD
jgi:CRISPR-associated exonuclease Cas4